MPHPTHDQPTPPNAAPGTELLRVTNIRKAFRRADDSELLVLDSINLTLRKGEIVGLLGRSGSGKSTLLRAICGLVHPSSGSVTFRGHEVEGPTDGITMVFQNFALFPWLSVQENVELGLEARQVDSKQARIRSESALSLVGLSGFESAYPKELSGGMRQRVGFARALVVDPEILLMDEPFSALDVLTAESLRNEFMDLWSEGRIPIGAVLIVTHNIEEAVQLCDRVVIFSSNPGRIIAEMPIHLPRPRDRNDEAFRQIVDDIYVRMTEGPQPTSTGTRQHRAPMSERLPAVGSNQMAGLLEALESDYQGRADLPQLADALALEIDDLFPIAEALHLFGFADVGQGDIVLTHAGRAYVEADTNARKHIFAEHLLAHISLAAHIHRVLVERPNHRAPKHRFIAELEDHFSDEEAQSVLETAIEWGRWGEVFAYDHKSGLLRLETNSDTPPAAANT
ncbi:MAG: nitrate/sulfonate/bicarbonate ABC transporter ATP-binding protein [Candidatus Symbiobacter sp.]|nr:nitrate/sulfonate/bicarbonate ABC transporter ATP-binding protein [Candidatus Symbiobacter sp.]